MASIYVSYSSSGADTLPGNGSSAHPFKTLGHALTLLTPTNEIVLSGNTADIASESGTLVLSGLTNVTIRCISSAVIQPSAVDSSESIIHIVNCSNVRLENLTFGSAVSAPMYHSAILVENSSDITIDGCSTISSYIINADDATAVFNVVNSTGTKIIGCRARECSNGANTAYSFIHIEGDGNHKIYSSGMDSIYSNDGTVRGIHIESEAGVFEIDGFDMLHRDYTKDTANRVIGILIDGQGDKPTVLVNACFFTNLDVGVRIVNSLKNYSSPTKIKRSIFQDCLVAVHLDNAASELANLTISTEKLKMYLEAGIVQWLATYGVFAQNSSSAHVYNTILSGIQVGLHAETLAVITAEFSVWYNCQYFSRTLNTGKVQQIQFIRSRDPEFVSVTAGNFNVKDTSACLESGKRDNDPYLGSAPDIGAMERTKAIRTDELPAFLHRISRNSITTPMTEIDIEGIILKGLETVDASVVAAREGSAIRDIAVKPLRTILGPYTTELEYLRQRLSFNDLAVLTDADADMLASNVFVTRRSGVRASGVVRIYFYEPRDCAFPAEFAFQSASGQVFYTRQTTDITSIEMQMNYENGAYYMDVIIDAENVGMFNNISAGAINGSKYPLPTGVLSVTNPYPISNGVEGESNSALYRRAKYSITVRDLNTTRGIQAVLLENFSSIVDITSIGFGDPEMGRDVINGYHVGGHVDVYLKTKQPVLDSTTIVFEDESENPVSVKELSKSTTTKCPLLYISSIEIIDVDDTPTGDFLEPTDWWTTVSDSNDRFSDKEVVYLHVSEDYAGFTLLVNFAWSPDITVIQDWIVDSQNRVVCADMLVKHMVPCVVDVGISYTAPAQLEGINYMISEYIQQLTVGQALLGSDILQRMYSVGATWVGMPILLTGRLQNLDGTETLIESNDYLQVSRTVGFIPGAISVTYVPSL